MRRLAAQAQIIGAALILGVALYLAGSAFVFAHHSDHGHSGYLYLPTYELNGRTATGQSIPIADVSGDANWQSALSSAISNWNGAVSSTAGFSVYTSGSGYVTVAAGSDTGRCGFQPGGSPWHSCVTGWFPNTPSGQIYMYNPAFGDQTHRLSDLMHEMGHVLYDANEHYPTYNGTSIMGHDGSLTTVTSHDIQDYKDAYGIKDAPNAAYSLLSGSTLTHYFEGGYLGGNGLTIHQEIQYWIDRSTTGVTGSYNTYKAVARKIDNTDDTTANSVAYFEIPVAGGEWCMKIRGQAGGLASNQGNYWGPLSNAYCIARDSGNIYSSSDRNLNVIFRVYNQSGATIVNPALRLADPNQTYICSWASISPGQVASCSVGLSGPGYLNLFYNNSWVPLDSIGYQ